MEWGFEWSKGMRVQCGNEDCPGSGILIGQESNPTCAHCVSQMTVRYEELQNEFEELQQDIVEAKLAAMPLGYIEGQPFDRFLDEIADELLELRARVGTEKHEL